MALAIQAEGGRARSLLGHQVRILTDAAFTKAHIRTIDGTKIVSTPSSAGKSPSSPASRGSTSTPASITTLGRGGSDTSAVAVAAAIGAESVRSFTDVTGVFTTDPSVCPSARKIDRIS